MNIEGRSLEENANRSEYGTPYIKPGRDYDASAGSYFKSFPLSSVW